MEILFSDSKPPFSPWELLAAENEPQSLFKHFSPDDRMLPLSDLRSKHYCHPAMEVTLERANICGQKRTTQQVITNQSEPDDESLQAFRCLHTTVWIYYLKNLATWNEQHLRLGEHLMLVPYWRKWEKSDRIQGRWQTAPVLPHRIRWSKRSGVFKVRFTVPQMKNSFTVRYPMYPTGLQSEKQTKNSA